MSMNQSMCIRGDSPPLLETWRRFYNGPNAGLIDVAFAKREVPWLVGESQAVTVRFQPVPVQSSVQSSNEVAPEA